MTDDYVERVEPSGAGGLKIATAMVNVIAEQLATGADGGAGAGSGGPSDASHGTKASPSPSSL